MNSLKSPVIRNAPPDTHSEKYGRPELLKRKYDPDNFFSLN